MSSNAGSTVGETKPKNTQTRKKPPTKSTDMMCLKAPVTICMSLKILENLSLFNPVPSSVKHAYI